MAEHEVVFILQQPPDKGIYGGEGRMLFELGIVVGEFEPPLSLAVGEVKSPLGIDEDVLLFYYVEGLVADDVTERAYLGHVLVDAGALDIEKD